MHHRAGPKATILKRCGGDDGCYTPYLEADNVPGARIAARDLNLAAATTRRARDRGSETT